MPTTVMLLSLPLTVALLAAVLALSALAEQHFLSPRSLVVSVVRARHNTPEFAEAFVARQLEQLVAAQRPTPTGDALRTRPTR
ncbi:MAG: hypothetical protein ACRDZW_07010 [Acidimicrobiales bacterium]